MPLEKLPSIITNNEFNDNGLVKTDSGMLVPAYVGSQFGFSVPGKYYLDNIFYPKLRELGILALCPFTACAEYLDFSKLNDSLSVKELIDFWDSFNRLIGPVNYETLMPHSKMMIALFDGSHAADDGLSSEVAYFAPRYGPVIGIRSDFRLAENLAAPINPAVRYFEDQGPFNGQFFSGPSAYDDAFTAIVELADKMREG